MSTRINDKLEISTDIIENGTVITHIPTGRRAYVKMESEQGEVASPLADKYHDWSGKYHFKTRITDAYFYWIAPDEKPPTPYTYSHIRSPFSTKFDLYGSAKLVHRKLLKKNNGWMEDIESGKGWDNSWDLANELDKEIGWFPSQECRVSRGMVSSLIKRESSDLNLYPYHKKNENLFLQLSYSDIELLGNVFDDFRRNPAMGSGTAVRKFLEKLHYMTDKDIEIDHEINKFS